ncbi:minor tail protein [Microbacterium phage AloeVera]|uniref:Minor tail protein n=3 Tax=Akonivirus akoni TaxID=2845587 RepID=A0A6M3SZ43_9CAUD|nr:minor tail protein [Microbacterium phage Akoni]QCG78321.1 minor tail protein [Microbacterium phage Akoni]QJD51285.1 minor tail protein [Microbacterium phage Truong]QJD51775.1 minor tail protein [Microbacterium phage Ashton]
MAYTGNSPVDEVILRLQARKSFSLGIWIEDQNENPLDITGCILRFVARKNVPSTVNDDSGNLVTNSQAIIMAPTLGYAAFNFQAAEMDWEPGDYLFSIVLSDSGYTATIVRGQIQLEQNTEFTSIEETYSPADPPTHLRAMIREGVALKVRTGPMLAPGEATFTNEDEKKLDELYAGAVAAGQVLSADLIPDGVSKVMMTTAERFKLANLTLEWVDINGKPDFGDIITHDVSEFVLKGQGDAGDIVTGTLNKNRVPTVMNLNGISHGTAAPPSGNPNTIYLKHS